MFDVNWKNLTGKSEAAVTDTVAKVLPGDDNLPVDSIPDSLRVLREPLILHIYEFRLKRMGSMLCGTLRNKVVEKLSMRRYWLMRRRFVNFSRLLPNIQVLAIPRFRMN